MGRQAGSYEGMEGLLEEAKRDGEYDRWLEGVRLAAHPNVYYDIGGYMAVWKRFDRYPYAIYAQWFDLVRAILDEVGIDKVFTGTDWPTVLRRGSYRECWDAVRYDIPFLSDTDRRKILGDNAARAFRTWGILPLGG
jgi:predicted TIM-barrel fold metal-dependent hydrolase